ncbi:MAG: glycoside hydrolase family 97 C-terminal domain-containing protein [Draconibacterium sp.]
MEFLSGSSIGLGRHKILDAKVSDYILAARKSGEKWLVGAMTD